MNQKSVLSREWRWVRIGDQMQQTCKLPNISKRQWTSKRSSSDMWPMPFCETCFMDMLSCQCVSHQVSFGIRVSNGWDSVVVVAAPCTAIQDKMQIHIWHMQDETVCLHGWGKTSYNIWLGSCNLAEADQVLSLGNPPPMPHPSPPWLSNKDI